MDKKIPYWLEALVRGLIAFLTALTVASCAAAVV